MDERTRRGDRRSWRRVLETGGGIFKINRIGADISPNGSSSARTKGKAGQMRAFWARINARGQGVRQRDFALAVHLVSLAAILSVATAKDEETFLPPAIRSLMGAGQVQAITAEDRPQRLQRQQSSGGAATHHSASLRAVVSSDPASLGWGTTVSLSANPLLNLPVVSLRTGGTPHPQPRAPVSMLSADLLLMDISSLYLISTSARHCKSQVPLTHTHAAFLCPRT